MKNSIEWHKECLKNRKDNIDRKKADLERLTNKINIADREICLYSAQIDLAEREKKDGFDQEKYALKRLYRAGDQK